MKDECTLSHYDDLLWMYVRVASKTSTYFEVNKRKQFHFDEIYLFFKLYRLSIAINKFYSHINCMI